MKKEYLSFEEARNFVRSLNLKSQSEWFEYCKSDNKPDNIPSNPNRTYIGWVNWGDWLGTFTIAPQNKDFLPFEEARIFARNLNLKTWDEWQKYCKSGIKPENIPSNPYIYKEWISWGDWLGTFNTRKKEFLSFKKAKKIVIKLNLNSQKEWKKYCKSGNKSENIPSNPYKIYKDMGWINWGDWLGTFSVYNKQCLPYNEAMIFIQKLGIKSKNQYIKWYKENNPKNLPSNPAQYYKNNF
jgi:hypothetical protein